MYVHIYSNSGKVSSCLLARYVSLLSYNLLVLQQQLQLIIFTYNFNHLQDTLRSKYHSSILMTGQIQHT